MQIQHDISEFEYIFKTKLHNIENFSILDLKKKLWAIVWVDEKNAILISSMGLLEFQNWGIFTNKYYIVLPNKVIPLEQYYSS